MGAVGITRDCDHENRLFKKYQTLDGLRALYETYAYCADGKCSLCKKGVKHYEPDHPEMQRIQKRIHHTENQLRNMRPGNGARP